jgi:hypothetical protein
VGYAFVTLPRRPSWGWRGFLFLQDQANNSYCAFNSDGSARTFLSSTANFKQAWRRVAPILRGGPVSTLDSRLHALGLPPVYGTHVPTRPYGLVKSPQETLATDTQADREGP